MEWAAYLHLLTVPVALPSPPQHRHRMVVLEPLNKLLQAKWDLLIPRFFLNFLCNLIYMFIFTAVAYHQPALKKARAGGGWGAHLGGGLLETTLGEDGAVIVLRQGCWSDMPKLMGASTPVLTVIQ